MTSFSSALCPPPPRPPNAALERPDMDGILWRRECGEGSVGRGAKMTTVRASVSVAEEERRCVHLSGRKGA